MNQNPGNGASTVVPAVESEILGTDDVMARISEVLNRSSGQRIADIHNMLWADEGKSVAYIGDSLFKESLVEGACNGGF